MIRDFSWTHAADLWWLPRRRRCTVLLGLHAGAQGDAMRPHHEQAGADFMSMVLPSSSTEVADARAGCTPEGVGGHHAQEGAVALAPLLSALRSWSPKRFAAVEHRGVEEDRGVEQACGQVRGIQPPKRDFTVEGQAELQLPP